MTRMRRRAASVSMGLLAVVAVSPVRAEQPASPKASPVESVPASANSAAPSQPTSPLAGAASSGVGEAVAVEYRTVRTEADALQLAQQFLENVMAGEYQAAFVLIRPYFPISPQRFARLQEEVAKQHGLAELQFGKPVGSDYVDTQRIGQTMLRVRILEKFDLDVTYWEFVFYRPAEGWILNGVGCDDAVRELFPH